MKRPKKFRKKRAARKKTAPALTLKGSGMGHDFSIFIYPKLMADGSRVKLFSEAREIRSYIFCLKRRSIVNKLRLKKILSRSEVSCSPREFVEVYLQISLHPPSHEATVSRPWRNAGVLRSLGEAGLELRRVTPNRRCHGLLSVGLHRSSIFCFWLPCWPLVRPVRSIRLLLTKPRGAQRSNPLILLCCMPLISRMISFSTRGCPEKRKGFSACSGGDSLLRMSTRKRKGHIFPVCSGTRRSEF